MEFKKRRENKDFRSPLIRCKAIFVPGIRFNNGSIIDKPEQNIVNINSVSSFMENDDKSITMRFENKPGNSCAFTVYKDGKYADIIS